MFARWTNGLYYRGFVTSVSSTTVHVNYDDGDTITLPKTDLQAVILDTLVCYSDVRPGQRVIGFGQGEPGTTLGWCSPRWLLAIANVPRNRCTT